VDPRQSRLAKNEAVFREVNERVVEIREELGQDPRPGELVDGLICECSDPRCVERVGPLTLAEYEAVRSDPRHFVIAPNHQALEVESVVERNGRYWVVEKDERVLASITRDPGS
jgi:hypothetical protein